MSVEHISLEEISSDSNDELNKPKKSKKHSSKSTKKTAGTAKAATTAKATAAKQSDTKTSNAGANGKATGKLNSSEPISLHLDIELISRDNFAGEKQYSILELLELQARARAIRSQLALEPVTKIELDDSDDETTVDKGKETESIQPPKEISTNDKNVTQTVVTNLTNVTNDHVTSTTTNKNTPPESIKSTSEPTVEPRVPSSRPIRLKRNFRSRQIDEEDTPVQERENTEKITETSVEKPAEKSVDKSPAKTPEKCEENTNDRKAASEVHIKLFEIDSFRMI